MGKNSQTPNRKKGGGWKKLPDINKNKHGGMHKNQFKHQIKRKWGGCFNVVTMCIKLKQMSIELKKK